MTDARDQAYAALYLASEMGKAVTGQVIQVDNGQFL
jgi:3-oxoacyl-[acyl-carrier protein] reductase